MISRREGLQWIAAAVALLPSMAAVPARAQTAAGPPLTPSAPWPSDPLARLAGPGYGTDPDLMKPRVTWPLTLTETQKPQVTVLCDLILPKDATSPGAGEAGVADFIDEWISAPYPTQQDDRDQILRGLAWLDAQATALGATTFAAATPAVQTQILDAVSAATPDPSLSAAADFFHRLRTLVILGFFTLPAGRAAIGYLGNTPTQGDWPGPSDEALTHFHNLLASLNLKDPGTPWKVV